MTKSALAEAFDTAIDDRLMKIGIDAWAKHHGVNAGGLRRDYVQGALCTDPTWALINGFQPGAGILPQAIGWLLNRAEKAIVAQRPKQVTARAVGGDRGVRDNHMPNVPAASFRDDVRPQVERRSESATVTSAPQKPAPVRSNLTALADKQALRSASRVETAIRLSRLDTFVINNQKIGDLTPAEANAWAGTHEIKVRFIRMLTANLPPGRPIREFVRGDEADAIYQRAEVDYAA